MDHRENSGRYYLTTEAFMHLSPVVRLCYHGTKSFFPQETWRETNYPVMQIDATVWEDSHRDYPNNEKCESWAHMMSAFRELPPAGHWGREYTIADLNQWNRYINPSLRADSS